MRVLWIGHFTPWPPRGGAPQRSYHLLRGLARHAEVHFLGLSQRGHQPRPENVEEARAALAEFCATATVVPARFRSSRAGKVLALARAALTGRAYGDVWLQGRAFDARVREACRTLAPDVVHVDSLMIERAGRVAAPLPAVLNHHNVESHMMARRAENNRGLARRVFAREGERLLALERAAARSYARHLVCSATDGQRLEELVGPVPWTVVANGVDTSDFTPPDVPRDANTVIFSGRMNWYPNEHAMLRFLGELWPAIVARAPRARLIVAGMNPGPKLEAAAARVPNVQVTGFVPDVRPVIGAAAVYVCPILDGGGTRLKMLDAMALGKAIVATPLGAEGIDVVDGHDVLVREFGPPFVDAVLDLLARPDRCAELGRAARACAVARYDWEAISAAHADALRSVLTAPASV